MWLTPTPGPPSLDCTPDSADRCTRSLGHKAAKATLCTGAGFDVRLLQPGKTQHRRSRTRSLQQAPRSVTRKTFPECVCRPRAWQMFVLTLLGGQFSHEAVVAAALCFLPCPSVRVQPSQSPGRQVTEPRPAAGGRGPWLKPVIWGQNKKMSHWRLSLSIKGFSFV